MFKNFLSTAVRNIWKQKGYTIINIVGLSLGMTCFMLILGFVLTELSYDRYHDKADQIFRITSGLTLGKTPNSIATTNAPPALAMREEFPEVIEALRVLPRKRTSVRYEDQEFYEDRIFNADTSIFDIFTLPLIKGTSESVLSRAYTAVLTEETAKRYFGESDPLGKSLNLGEEKDYTVTGVVKDVPVNSHFVFDILLSFETLNVQNRQRQESWLGPFIFHSYVLLEEGIDHKELEKKLPSLVDRHIGDSFERAGASVEYFLQPLTRIHLYSQLRHEISEHGDIKHVYTFSLIAIFVLLIACFNYINLATAQSTKRAREIGVKKVLGASRKSLVLQFLGESVICSLLSFLVAMGIVRLSLSSFRSLSGNPLHFNFQESPGLIFGTIFLPLVIGLFAGAYPAFALTSFKPVNVLNNNLKGRTGHSYFRKILVVSQFTISIGLIICIGIVFKQIKYMKNKNLGFEKEQILTVPIADDHILQSLDQIKQELTRNPNVISVSAASHAPGFRPSGGSYRPEGYLEGQTIMMDGMSMDADYIPTLGIEVLSGRNFSRDQPFDLQNAILINEAAVNEIGWKDPIGKRIGLPGQEEERIVVGVVKDFHYQFPQKPIRPLYISYGITPRNYRIICIKINSRNIPQTIDYLKDKWREFDPKRGLDYTFLDVSYEKQYQSNKRLSRIFLWFTVFSIFIACLGLIGMSSFSAQRRTKEIGVRRVFGASVQGILFLLLKESIWIVLLSFFLAVPLGFLAMNRWLRDFAFRIEIDPMIFIIAGGISVVIAMLTVTLFSVRAAMKNPAHTLRYE